MKTSKLISGICFLLFCWSNINISAKDIYVSSKGNDKQTGASPEMAVKTLSKALTLADNKDIIHVMDFIDLTQEPSKSGSKHDINGTNNYDKGGVSYLTWNPNGNEGVKVLNKAITLVGTDAQTSGFDGKGQTRLLVIDGAARGVTFSKLTFKNGNSLACNDAGSGLFVRNSRPVFEECRFEHNTAGEAANNNARRGGAVYLYSDAVFKNCHFSGNVAKEGAGLYISKGRVTMEKCTIENQDMSQIPYSMGGAVYLTNEGPGELQSELVLNGCVLRNNKVTHYGGALYFADRVENEKHSIRIENTALISNTVVQGAGGAIYVDNFKAGSTIDFKMINSTAYGNQSKVYGGMMFCNRGREGSEMTFVNCTITGNKVEGENGGGGTAFRFHCDTNSGEGETTTKNIIKRFYNTIVENNYPIDNPVKGFDLSFRGHLPENGVDFLVFNSFIGNIYAPKRYVPVKENHNFYGYGTDDFSGLATPADRYIAEQNCIPPCENGPAFRAGDARFLQELNITTDQLGNPRSFVDGKCAAGAVETPAVSAGSKGKGEAYTHIIMNGQSLSTGHQSWPVLTTENVKGNYMIGNQVWINYGNTDKRSFQPLVGTVSAAFARNQNIKSRSAGTIAECPLVAAVNHIRMLQPKASKIVATSVGTSGTSIEELSKECEPRTYYNDFLYSLIYGAKIARQSNSTIQCPAIFWMQGEFNHTPNNAKGLHANEPNTTTKEGYKALLLRMKENMQNDVLAQYGQKDKPLLITYQTGAQYVRGMLPISMAQLEASNENADIVCAGPVYPMTDRGGHLDANGYRWFGEMLGKVYYQTVVQKKDFKPLQPREIKKGKTANEVRIKFYVPVAPLVFDVNTLPKIKDYGFEVYLNGTDKRQTITNVAIDRDEVVITCQNPLEGDIIVMYAATKAKVENLESGKNALVGHGNLRDSDTAKAFYTYIDLDKKNADGSFLYPREASEMTLRPDYEPKDASGQVIYDQKYPLYNFSVGFCYTLPSGQDKLTVF